MYTTYSAAIGTFRKVQSEITSLSKQFAVVGKKVDFIDYLCRKCGIDREYYALWLNDINDFAELVVLYLSSEMREKINLELVQLELLAC